MKIFTTRSERFPDTLLRRLFTAAFWLAVWQTLYLSVGQEILIVSPAHVLQRLAELAADGGFWFSAGFSVLHIVTGFLFAVLTGAVLGAACARFRLLYDLFYPVVSIIKATPVASFIVLALVWIKSGNVPVFTSFLMVLPVVWENVCQGIRKTDGNLLEMARAFRFGRLKIVRRIYVPSVMPYFTAACTTGMGLAWKAGIAAEVLANTRDSIGGRIYGAKIYLETADLFAWTAVVIVMSVALEKLMLQIIRRAGRTYNAGSD